VFSVRRDSTIIAAPGMLE